MTFLDFFPGIKSILRKNKQIEKMHLFNLIIDIEATPLLAVCNLV